MASRAVSIGGVRQAVPFFAVRKMKDALRFYVESLGFKMTLNWIVKGKVRWCWLEIGKAAIMLQETTVRAGKGAGTGRSRLGDGVTVCFICDDALAIYREFKARGVAVSTPFVGNGMWVTSVRDPDGHRLEFESETDTPEDTQYSELEV